MKSLFGSRKEKLPSLKCGKFDLVEEFLRIVRLDGGKEGYQEKFGFLNRLARKWGFRIYNRDLLWFNDESFWSAWREFPEWKKETPDRKFMLWSLVRSTTRLDGDTAECGVLGGASSFLICKAFEAAGKKNEHHAFDSYEGLSEPKAEDKPDSATAFSWKEGDLSVPLEVAKSNLEGFSVNFYKGWIPERFPEVEDKRFSFVHIDVDLYEPTRDALEFFYPRMVKGGIILCDDYGFETCPGATRAFDDLVREKEEGVVVHVPTGQGYIVKG